jgi:hypothetical protein
MGRAQIERMRFACHHGLTARMFGAVITKDLDFFPFHRAHF